MTERCSKLISQLLISAIISALPLANTGCSGISKLRKKWSNREKTAVEKTGDIQKVAYFSARQGALSDTLEIRGRLQASEKIEIRADKRMRISAAKIKQFDKVKRGDILFLTDTGEFETKVAEAKERVEQLKVDLKTAKSQLEIAKKQLDRKQTLVKKGITAQKELDDADKLFVTADSSLKTKELELRKADRELEIAKRTISSANILSPIDGIVTMIIPGGDEINQSQTMATISNPTSLSLYVEVDERTVTRMPAGLKVAIRLDAVPDKTIAGTVKTSIATIKQNGLMKSYEIQINLSPDEVKSLQLRDGFEATMVVKFEERSNTIAVPISTIKMNGDKPYIFVASSRGSVPSARAVKLGMRTELETEVIEGIKAGELVVAEGEESGGNP